MIFSDFMVLNEKDLSFEKKRPRRFLPGSAAESEVQPPKVPDFRLWRRTFGRRKCPSFASGERVRPPKVPPKVPCPAFS
ncbi:hypothetical protein MANES_08G089240v8 [Manihot esculenta]|uniref:Uncharacterized protein n=1 Tax=Manihot esculenta TaxID=3983 RepID=A0ACB7H9W7_MANES|nr:hypothetical protein MANES_08G089240v8 [Manihot esculenta]